MYKNKIRKDVLELAVSFKKEMTKHGKGFKLPKAKDITETYHYRWFVSFLDECYDNDLSYDNSVEVMKSVVKYAKKNNLLNKGASLLSRSDILDIFIKDIEIKLYDIENTLNEFREIAGFLYGIEDLENFLCKKKHRRGLTNLESLINVGRLSNDFICLSKKCMRSFIKTNSTRMDLVRNMVILKHKLIDKIGDDELNLIFGSDYNGKK